ncbi:MAG: hypothetical protein FWC92_03740 [Defluviitaleaceae bacterium]|nr:hypothetical protein [Defluviitaleaceae bacterium]
MDASNSSNIYTPDMPMGLDIALAKNTAAKDYFYGLPKPAQMRIIERTHMIQNKDEMQAFADSLVMTGNMF